MKKLLFLSICFLALKVSAQSSLQLTILGSTTVIAPNATIFMTTSTASVTALIVDLKNISNTKHAYKVRRYDVLLNNVGTQDSAIANFCFGGNCYGSSPSVAPDADTLNPGQKASELDGTYRVLQTDLSEYGSVGLSYVKYTLFNTAIAADSVQFTIQYNGTSAYTINTPFGFGAVTVNSGTIDPTPSSPITGISFGAFTSVGNSANPAVANAFSFSGWPIGGVNGNDSPASMTGQLNTGNYYSVIVTPAPGYFVSLSSIEFDVNRSANGSRNYAVRSSADAYNTNLPASVGTNTNLSVTANTFFWNEDARFNAGEAGSMIDLSDNAYKNFSSPISFRFYSWNAEDANGTFSLEKVVFKGVTSLKPTGVGEISYDLNSKFKIYPNPSNDGLVTLETMGTNATVQVFNLLGSLVASQLASSSETKIMLNLNTLATGTYYVKLISATSSQVEKLIISK